MSADTHVNHYIKIWAILLVLFTISVLGPTVGIRWLTLITAFGIAIVKAYIVAAEFMHLKIEKKYITYMLLAMLIFVFTFFFGVAPDVMKFDGRNWQNSWTDQAHLKEPDHKELEEHLKRGHH